MRAYAHLDNGNYLSAIQDYSRIISANPNDFNQYFYRGLSYQKANDYQQAIRDYSMVLKLNPGNSSAYLNRAICYEAMQQYTLALQDAKAAKNSGQQVSESYIAKLQGLAK
jgi:tetratricopeptide (TPR) repeat protein